MSKPAYIYARYSSNRQKEDSIDRQVKYARQMIEKNGWVLAGTLTDEAKSAFKGANRLEGSALYDFEIRAREGEFKDGAVLVCENVDRLSRQGAKASARLVWSLNEAGVDVATYHDGHIYKSGDDTELMDLFSIIIKGALSREESDKKSKRSQAFWDKMFENIKDGNNAAFTTQCPAWIEVIDGKYVLNEHRAKIVRQMFEWYCNGLGTHTILYKLREMGELSWSSEKRYKNMKEWTPRYIQKVLTSRQVLGEYVTVKGETLSTDFYPRVVDNATFDRAQQVRQGRSKLGGDERKRAENIFNGIVKCGECGKSATVTSWPVKKLGIRRRALRCNEARYRHVACNNRASVSFDVLSETVLSQMLPYIVRKELTPKKPDNFDLELQVKQTALTDVTKKIDNIVDAISSGTNETPKSLLSKLETLEADKERLELDLIRAKANRPKVEFLPDLSAEEALIREMKTRMDSDDDETRLDALRSINTSLRLLLHKIEVLPEGGFCIWLDENSRWWFDDAGHLLEGETVYPA